MSKLLIKDASRKLIEGIAAPLSKLGFYYDKKKYAFKRKVLDCEQLFHLLFHKKDNGIYIEPIIRIKIKSIEDIYHKVSRKESKYNEGTTTLGNNLYEIVHYFETGNDAISKYMNMRYLVESYDDIETLINTIPVTFQDFALPYFESNKSISSVDHLLNTNPRESSIHNFLYPIRAIIGLIAAKLNENPNYPEIMKIYEEELKNANPDNKAEFEELIKLLNVPSSL